MRPHGKTKLGFFPLPVPEAERLKNCLDLPVASSLRSIPVLAMAWHSLTCCMA